MTARRLTTAIAASLIASVPVFAQDVAERASSEPSAPAEQATEPAAELPHRAAGIEEIVVTARKREESLQDVPVAVTAISRADLDRYNVSDLTKVSQVTPQVIITEAPSGNGGSLFIRGIGSDSTSAGIDQSVSIYLDGLQYDRGNVLSQGHFDLAGIEILKGPQALFFGKNSTAGVVSLRSADPGPERELIGRYGHEREAGEHWAEAIASQPITDTFRVRVGVRYSLLDGWIENLAPATTDAGSSTAVPVSSDDLSPRKDEFLGRLTLSYQPIEALDVKFKVAGAKLDGGNVGGTVELFSCKALGFSQVEPDEDCKGDWKIRHNDLAPAIAATEPLFDEEGGALYNKYHSYNLVLTTNYELPVLPAKLTSVSGYARFDHQYLGDFDFTGTSAIFAAEEASHRSISEELRLLTSFDFPANVMVGGYVQDTAYRFHSLGRLLPVPADPTTGRYVTLDRHSPTDGSTGSAFGQLIWNVTKTVELAPGLRYSHIRKESFAVNDYLHPLTAALWRPVGNPLVGNFTDDDLSPEIPLTWRPDIGADSTLTLYGAYKRGFKAGGFSNSAILRAETTPEDALFDSEKVSGFEGGVKSTWFDRALLVNVVGYTYEFKDLQVNFFDSSAVNYVVANAAELTTTGAETELVWLPPLEGLELHGAFGYNIARFGEFLSFCYAGQTNTQGCNLDENGQPATGPGVRQDLSDTTPALAPRWGVAMGLLYEHGLSTAFGRPFGFALSADSNYTDVYFLNPLGRLDARQPSYFRTDGSLSFRDGEGLWEIAFIGRNLSDTFVLLYATDSPLSGQGTGTPTGVLADQISVVGRRREIALQITARF